VELPVFDEPASAPHPSTLHEPQGETISTEAFIPDHLKAAHDAIPNHLKQAGGDPSLATPPPYPYPFTSGYAPNYNTFPWTAVGRLYYSYNGNNYGGTAAAAGKYVVYTSATTLFSAGQWSENIIYVPAYNNNNAPYSYFTGYQSFVSKIYAVSYNQSVNYGLVVLNKVSYNGNQFGVGELLGNFGCSWNLSPFTSLTWRITGYPSASPFTGNANYYTDSPYATTDPNFSPAPIGVGNDASGGITGAPWVYSWGVSYQINSVAAYRYNSRPLTLYGPYFGSDSYQLYTSATAIIPQ